MSGPRSLGGEGGNTIKFKVSAGLKRVIGRDLITDDEVAIFELVKNSYDAGAKKVQIYFDLQRIIIADNGHGMGLEDIEDKWMRVAYSSKRHGHEDYRDQISERRHKAGSKGIGRFSSDRLGENLRLQSRPKGRAQDVHVVHVDWDHFEKDEKQDFIQIPAKYSVAKDFDLPAEIKSIKRGTALEITNLRGEWGRKKLLALKASLAKLINPFGMGADDFQLDVIAPDEVDGDDEVREDYESWSDQDKEDYDFPTYNLVNGPVENFIFEALEGKTTSIDVFISDDGEYIESALTDRGEEVYSIRESNPFDKLIGSGFHCTLFYLNRSAKATFARRMGVDSVHFGSVFLFRNGIRVYPFGELGDDSLAIDAKKQQGHSRFLGTRDLIGRINVSGSDVQFMEVSSRNQGLVRTPAYDQLYQCFWDKCLKRLQHYVVGVTWPDKGDKNVSDLSRLLNDPARARVAEVIASLAKADEVEVLSYSEKLVKILDEKSEEFEGALKNLKVFAQAADNKPLLNKIIKAEKRFVEVQKSEQEARAIADAERAAREKVETTLQQTTEQLVEEQKRALFLTSLATQDLETVQNLHHQIVIYAAGINLTLTKHLEALQRGKNINKEDLFTLLSELSFKNQKVLSAARFATKANFRLESDYIQEDLIEFVVQYVEEVMPIFIKDIKVSAFTDGSSFQKKFKPIEVSMMVDNLINNAQKAGATEISFTLSASKKDKYLSIVVEDDGHGLSPKIAESDRVFEKGVTTTKGSGLGLFHVRQILGNMGGSITVDSDRDEGLQFLIVVA